RREGGARVAHLAEERVLHLLGPEPDLARHHGVAPRVRPVERELREVPRRKARLLEEAAHHVAHVLAVAMVDDEAVLPRVHERIALAPPDVDDLVGHRMRRLEARGDVGVAEEERGGAVGEVRLERPAPPGPPGLPPAIAASESRSIGMYAPYDETPTIEPPGGAGRAYD